MTVSSASQNHKTVFLTLCLYRILRKCPSIYQIILYFFFSAVRTSEQLNSVIALNIFPFLLQDYKILWLQCKQEPPGKHSVHYDLQIFTCFPHRSNSSEAGKQLTGQSLSICLKYYAPSGVMSGTWQNKPCLKRNLDKTKSYLYGNTLTIPIICNLSLCTCNKRNLSVKEKFVSLHFPYRLLRCITDTPCNV